MNQINLEEIKRKALEVIDRMTVEELRELADEAKRMEHPIESYVPMNEEEEKMKEKIIEQLKKEGKIL